MDLPEPLSPTSATVAPAGMEREKSSKTGTSGRAGYANCTPAKSMPPWSLGSSSPGASSSIAGRRSITWKTARAAMRASAMLERFGRAWPMPKAPMRTEKKMTSTVPPV